MPCGRGAFAAGKTMLFVNLNTKIYALHAFTLHDSFDYIVLNLDTLNMIRHSTILKYKTKT
jgi:hypothetical protein